MIPSLSCPPLSCPPTRRPVPPTRPALLLAGTCLLALVAPAARAADAPAPAAATGDSAPGTGNGASGNSTLGADTAAGNAIPDIVVTAQRFRAARSDVQASLGASTYTIDQQALQALPGGTNNGLNQVILQAPGVAQDSYGQLHIRGEHNNLQYRINGVILPDGIAVFSQSISTKLADKVDLITGALPAEYGLRTAGIIDIQTQSGAFNDGGEMTLYGGSHGTFQPSVNAMGSVGKINYFVSADYLRDDLGIENTTSSKSALHDHTDQGHGFVFLQDNVNDNNQISVFAGTTRAQFQIPNNPGQTPTLGLSVDGVSSVPSATLNENQREITHYGAISWLTTQDRLTVQTSLYGRYSSLYFSPDRVGDLLYNGIAEQAYRQDVSFGWQTDASYKLTDHHTLRFGGLLTTDRASGNTTSWVLPLDGNGAQTQSGAEALHDSNGKTGYSESAYVQDEWKIIDGVTFNFGGRFDHYTNYTSGTQFSPRANVVWQPDDKTTVHVGYSRYFTPPPFELVANSTVGLYTGTSAAPPGTLNSAPKPERANYYDVGIERHINDQLTVGLDGYYKTSTNLIDEGQFGAPIILTPFNYAEGYQEGLELTTSYNNGPFSAYANLSVSRAQGKNITSAQFNFSPDDLAYISRDYIFLDHDQTYSVSAGASYRVEETGTRLSGDLIYGSGLRADGDVPNGRELPQYVTVNLGVVQPMTLPGMGEVEARLTVNNVFDESYEIRDGTGIGVGAPQFGARRGYFFGLTKLF